MQSPERRYHLGQFAYELGLAAATHFNLRDLCSPYLERICAETSDTAFLTIRSGSDSFCLDRRSGSYPIQVLTVEIGKRRPLGIGGGGLALLSFMPPQDLPEVLDLIAPRIAEYGGLTTNLLLPMIEMARERGYACITDFAVAGVTSIGMPIFNKNGGLLGAFSVSAVTPRMLSREALVVQTLKREIAALQQRL